MKKSLLFVLLVCSLVGLFAFADHTGDSNETGNHQTNVQSTDTIACVTTAVTVRDAAIKAGISTYGAISTTTFAARTAAFIATLSFTNTKEVNKAMYRTWKTNEKAIKIAEKAARKIKKGVIQTSWKTYRTSLKDCNTDIAKGFMQERGAKDLN